LQKNFIHEFPFHPCAPIPSHVQSIPFVSSNKSKESIQLSHKFHLHCHFISMLSTSSCGEFIPSIHFLAFIRSLHLFVSSRSWNPFHQLHPYFHVWSICLLIRVVKVHPYGQISDFERGITKGHFRMEKKDVVGQE
jgi:hypothetical protein